MKSSVDKIVARFKVVENKISKESWFKKNNWIISVHSFPNEKNPEAITFQVFKKHWWNDENHSGIHIESYLSLDLKKQKKTYVTLHLLHLPKIPGTNIKRICLSQLFVDQIYTEVKKWPGYKFRAGRYGTQPFTKFLDGTAVTFEDELSDEVRRICVELGPTLDKSISQVLKIIN